MRRSLRAIRMQIRAHRLLGAMSSPRDEEARLRWLARGPFMLRRANRLVRIMRLRPPFEPSEFDVA